MHWLAAYLKTQKVHFIGNGVEKFSKICEHENAIFVKNKLPSAKEMAIISFQKFEKKDFVDLSYWEP